MLNSNSLLRSRSAISVAGTRTGRRLWKPSHRQSVDLLKYTAAMPRNAITSLSTQAASSVKRLCNGTVSVRSFVRTSVCLSHSPAAAACRQFAAARPAGSRYGFDRLLHQRRAAAAGSVTLSARVGNWTQIMYAGVGMEATVTIRQMRIPVR